jgi:hypothetical protein
MADPPGTGVRDSAPGTAARKTATPDGGSTVTTVAGYSRFQAVRTLISSASATMRAWVTNSPGSPKGKAVAQALPRPV